MRDTEDKTAIKTTIISGILSMISAIAAALVSGYISKNITVNQIISQVKVDTVDIEDIGDLIKNYNQLSSENFNLKEENHQLDADNVKLKEENDLLKESLQQSVSLEEENNSLKIQIEQLQHELQSAQGDSDIPESNIPEERKQEQSASVLDDFNRNGEGISALESSGQKTSIFDLDVFQEKVPSYEYSEISLGIEDIGNNIDTFGREYSTGRLCFHSTRPEKEIIPTYVLNKKYKICEGQIAWLKRYKNRPGTIWIEFYAGDSLIYQTEPIEALDGEKSFEFSVEGCEELTVIAKSSSTNMYVIYPYFNLIE